MLKSDLTNFAARGIKGTRIAFLPIRASTRLGIFCN